MKTKTLFLFIPSLLTACSGPLGFVPTQRGIFVLQADKAGMAAAGDALNALVTNGKEDKNRTSAAWVTRRLQEVEQTKRETFLLDPLFHATQNELKEQK